MELTGADFNPKGELAQVLAKGFYGYKSLYGFKRRWQKYLMDRFIQDYLIEKALRKMHELRIGTF